jgi:hypothetical protein
MGQPAFGSEKTGKCAGFGIGTSNEYRFECAGGTS